MAERFFRFKQFAVKHERAAMKVGTDGVTLGAMAPPGRRVLDVGCGCGLIGLMMAQRGAQEVVMLDIDAEAAAEAAENAAASPWSGSIRTICADFLAYNTDVRFDTIVCNPPFFATGLVAPDPRRAAARHEYSLPAQAFMAQASALLSAAGAVSVILPPDRLKEWTFAAELAGLKCGAVCELQTRPGGAARRVVATFSRVAGATACSRMSLNSPEYKNLTSPFYL